MKIIIFILCLIQITSPDYTYQLDPLVTENNRLYGIHWEFVPIVNCPWKFETNIHFWTEGRIVAYKDKYVVWDNKDSAFVILRYWYTSKKQSQYKVIWFIRDTTGKR